MTHDFSPSSSFWANNKQIVLFCTAWQAGLGQCPHSPMRISARHTVYSLILCGEWEKHISNQGSISWYCAQLLRLAPNFLTAFSENQKHVLALNFCSRKSSQKVGRRAQELSAIFKKSTPELKKWKLMLSVTGQLFSLYIVMIANFTHKYIWYFCQQT